MGFAIGIEEEKLQEKAIRGIPQKVAADCWFTSTGKMIPRMIKYEDSDGVRHLYFVKCFSQKSERKIPNFRNGIFPYISRKHFHMIVVQSVA